MRKAVIMMMVLVLSVLLGAFAPISVYAKNTLVTDTGSSNTLAIDAGATGKECGVLGSTNDSHTFAFYLQILFNIIKFLGPVLVLVMSIVDLVKLIAEQKTDEGANKLFKKTLKRLVYAAIIFALPSLFEYLLGLFGIIGFGTCVL